MKREEDYQRDEPEGILKREGKQEKKSEKRQKEREAKKGREK